MALCLAGESGGAAEVEFAGCFDDVSGAVEEDAVHGGVSADIDGCCEREVDGESPVDAGSAVVVEERCVDDDDNLGSSESGVARWLRTAQLRSGPSGSSRLSGHGVVVSGLGRDPSVSPAPPVALVSPAPPRSVSPVASALFVPFGVPVAVVGLPAVSAMSANARRKSWRSPGSLGARGGTAWANIAAMAA